MKLNGSVPDGSKLFKGTKEGTFSYETMGLRQAVEELSRKAVKKP